MQDQASASASQQLALIANDLVLFPVGLSILASSIKYVPPSTAHYPNVESLVPDIIQPIYKEHGSSSFTNTTVSLAVLQNLREVSVTPVEFLVFLGGLQIIYTIL